MEGGALQLAAYGPQDLFLTGNPQMTFFIGVYKRYTNFAIEQVREYFNGLLSFGKSTYCEISREGDLINQVFLYCKLPALPQDPSDPCYSASWINSIGNALIRKVEIEIGGVVIDTRYGEWLEIWNELTLPDDKQDGYFDMIGKHEYFNSTMQGGEQELYIPLDFWFCRNIGLSLPLVAIQHHNIRFNFDIRKFTECWTSSDGTLRAMDDGRCPTEPRIEEAFLYVDHIFLDDAERRAFVNNDHKYLIEQLQIFTRGVDFDTVDYQINLDFKLPTKEIFWVIRHDTTCSIGIPENGSELFNFSDRPFYSPGIPQDPMLSARIQLEGNDLFKERLNKFFREIQPFQRHTRVPRNFIYTYSFALYPEEWWPSGTINLSRVDTFTVNMRIKDDLPAAQIVFYGINYNVFEVRAGMAGVVFAN